MIGIDYNISRIDSISIQFEDDATVSFALSGKLLPRLSNPDQNLEANPELLEADRPEKLLAEISELLGRWRLLYAQSLR
jgi:hypothetical protein